MKNLMNISMGSVAGAGIGVAIGYYLFKQNTVLPLMAFGIGGAIVSGYVTNAMTPKPKPVVKNPMPQLVKDVEESTYTENDGDVMEFDETLGYMLPKSESEVVVGSMKDEMSLSL
tara:strand:+ start:351 stop:695 length:345 start_codon:yes stop_codon:yes gene_type:complete